MTKSEIIRNLITDKDNSILNKNEFYQNIPNNYLLQRYLSMTAQENLLIINETTNKIYDAFEDDLMMYKLCMSLIPKNEYKYTYLKKAKKKSDEELEKKIAKQSERYEVSRKEIKEWIKMKDKVEV